MTRIKFSPPPAHLATMGENNTLTALKGYGVKTVTGKKNALKQLYISLR